jgi:hypothetical protein
MYKKQTNKQIRENYRLLCIKNKQINKLEKILVYDNYFFI